MVKKYSLLLLACACVLTSNSANASDFSGFRAEIFAGADILKNAIDGEGEQTYDDPNDSEEPYTHIFAETEKHSRTGLAYGITVGYDFPLIGEDLYLGVEASASLSTARAKLAKDNADILNNINKAKPKRDLALGARIGYAIGDNTLAYLKAGYVNGRFVTSGYSLLGLNNQEIPYPLGYKESRNLDGYRIGAGVERKISSKAYVKIDYSFTEYESTHRSFDGEFLQMPWAHSVDIHTKRHQVTVGIGTRL